MHFDASGSYLVSRRRLLVLGGALGLPLACSRGVFASFGEETYDLSCKSTLAEFRRVKVVVESSGKLLVRPAAGVANGRVVNQEEAPLRPVPFELEVTQLFDERLMDQSEQMLQSLRYYRNVEGTMKVAQLTTTPALADTRKWIASRVDAEGRAYFSPVEPLKREELELVDIPANALVLQRLAPTKPVKIGETWRHDNSVLEALLAIDKILEQKDVKSQLVEVKDQVAIISFTGAIVGSVQSAKTEMQLQAKYNVDLKNHEVTWFALGMSEKREVSAAQPGFESTVRIRLATMPIDPPAELSDANRDRMDFSDPLHGKILTFESTKGGFRFLHDNRWFTMVDRADGSVLRLVDRGDVVAQCTIVDLPKLSPGQRTSLNALQADVQAKLGKTFQAIVEASESTTESGMTLQRVVASALADDVPVTWIHYLAIADDGRRVSLRFTHDVNLAERFAAADVTIASSLQLIEKEKPTGSSAATTKPVDASGAQTSSLKSAVK